jgi:glycerophosphoryl diester phosphodiesterase
MKKFDVQGHRGCRGSFPENTIVAFEEALRLGVTTLEMDVVITGDGEVLVSHEPFMSHEYCLDPQGNAIPEQEALKHNIYLMSLAEVQQYDCGSAIHPRFPQQQKVKAIKPLLSEVIAFAESYAIRHHRPLPYYNIEIKSTVEGDGIFHPPVHQFASMVMSVIDNFEIHDRTTIQCFDVRALQYLKEQEVPLKLSLLVENDRGAQQNISELGFLPEFYSPDYLLIKDTEIDWLQSMGIGVLPWTINQQTDMIRFLEMGVEGIITDYPAMLIELMNAKS